MESKCLLWKLNIQKLLFISNKLDLIFKIIMINI